MYSKQIKRYVVARSKICLSNKDINFFQLIAKLPFENMILLAFCRKMVVLIALALLFVP